MRIRGRLVNLLFESDIDTDEYVKRLTVPLRVFDGAWAGFMSVLKFPVELIQKGRSKDKHQRDT